ncbi:MAG TPA: glycosyltransferase family 4 protein, partial [Clostridium sp.]
EDIIKNYNGIIVENRNHKALVNGLKEFNQKLQSFDSKIIRERCIESYCEKVIIDKIKKVYKELK